MVLARAAAVSIFVALLSIPAVAADEPKWGALALDTEKAERAPYYGVGGGATEEEASAEALKNCKDAGGAACKVLVPYEQCGALAVSGTGDAGWGKAPTKTTAEAQAIAGCQNDKCKIVASDCNGDE
jgi:hypothetical protein